MFKLARWVTVREVARTLGVVLTKGDAWSVGRAIRDEYVQHNGEPPPYALRPKTSGKGSHCFAVYPPEFRTKIRKAIRARAGQAKEGGECKK